MEFQMPAVGSEHKGSKDTCESALKMRNENCYWFRTLLKFINSSFSSFTYRMGKIKESSKIILQKA